MEYKESYEMNEKNTKNNGEIRKFPKKNDIIEIGIERKQSQKIQGPKKDKYFEIEKHRERFLSENVNLLLAPKFKSLKGILKVIPMNLNENMKEKEIIESQEDYSEDDSKDDDGLGFKDTNAGDEEGDNIIKTEKEDDVKRNIEKNLYNSNKTVNNSFSPNIGTITSKRGLTIFQALTRKYTLENSEKSNIKNAS